MFRFPQLSQWFGQIPLDQLFTPMSRSIPILWVCDIFSFTSTFHQGRCGYSFNPGLFCRIRKFNWRNEEEECIFTISVRVTLLNLRLWDGVRLYAHISKFKVYCGLSATFLFDTHNSPWRKFGLGSNTIFQMRKWNLKRHIGNKRIKAYWTWRVSWRSCGTTLSFYDWEIRKWGTCPMPHGLW